VPRVACIQSGVVFADPDENFSVLVSKLEEAKKAGAEVVVFPECFLTGYCVAHRAAAEAIAIERSSPVLNRIQTEVDRLDVILIVGFAEKNGELLVNTAALFEPGLEPRYYEKTHLPELGYDNFVTPGNELPVFETRVGKIGILICFDLRFPEPFRALCLKGADLIALPTNWPEGADVSADLVAKVRAVENKVFLATCNRTGSENGFTFIGKSKIITPMGQILDEAGPEEKILIADLDFSESRNKRIVTRRGEYEITVFDARRPELYGNLVSPEPS
jgi:5-aminopentanamidase